ncbi:MAG: hypothetical protein P1U56_26790 [Saprospiraceae bacterium]|nr:hypothetical protein [Saprospiraceae bacterium]
MKTLLTIFSFVLLSNISLCSQDINISGSIWVDSDGNSMFNGENNISGVTIYLRNAENDAIIDSTISNDNNFEFPSSSAVTIEPTTYILEIPTKEFLSGGSLFLLSSCTGSNDADDGIDLDDNGSDQWPLTTTVFTLESGLVDYIDFCFYALCDEPNPLASTSCDEITEDFIICGVSTLANFCNIMPTAESPGNQPLPLCFDGGTPNNISWFAFVADDGDYSIIVTPSQCFGSTTGVEGVQIGLYKDCSFSENVFCSAECSLEPVEITSDILEAGEVYYFFIDGCSGSVCSYEIDVVGSPFPPSFEVNEVCLQLENNFLCDNLTTCTNQAIEFVADYENNSALYSWQIITLSGTPYSGNPNPITEDNTFAAIFNDIGIYNVCLTEIEIPCNDLDWTGSLCRTITTSAPSDEVFNSIAICELSDFNIELLSTQDPNGDGLFGWVDVGYSFNYGTNMSMVTDENECTYSQEIYIQEIGIPEITIIASADTLCVGDTLAIELTTSGVYDSVLWDLNGIQQGEPIDFLLPELGTLQLSATIFGECGTDTNSIVAQVLDTISAPTITCDTSTVDFILLTWPSVEGVDGYWIAINNGAPSILSDTFFILANSNPGEEIKIEFNVLDETKCVGPNISFDCIAPVILSAVEVNVNEISIIPNPARNQLYIESKTILQDAQYTIHSKDGSLQKRGIIQQDMQIDLLDLTPGLYMISIFEMKSKTSLYKTFVKM